jgi:hypothetical protein
MPILSDTRDAKLKSRSLGLVIGLSLLALLLVATPIAAAFHGVWRFPIAGLFVSAGSGDGLLDYYKRDAIDGDRIRASGRTYGTPRHWMGNVGPLWWAVELHPDADQVRTADQPP